MLDVIDNWFAYFFQKHAMSLIHQFYAHVLWLDEHIPEDELPRSILVSCYYDYHH